MDAYLTNLSCATYTSYAVHRGATVTVYMVTGAALLYAGSGFT